MSDIIRKYYENNRAPKFLLDQKLKKFDRNKDVAKEFEGWIKSGKYKTIGAVSEEGYTAKKLAGMSKYLNGEGAFMMLIELRENPNYALKQIAEGFKYK